MGQRRSNKSRDAGRTGVSCIYPGGRVETGQLVEYFVGGVKVGAGFRKVPAVGERLNYGGKAARWGVVASVEPARHPYRFPGDSAAAVAHLTPETAPARPADNHAIRPLRAADE